LNFENKMKKLEEISKRIQEGSLTMEETFSDFDKGMELAGELETLLEIYERKIEILKEGKTESFNDEKTESFFD